MIPKPGWACWCRAGLRGAGGQGQRPPCSSFPAHELPVTPRSPRPRPLEPSTAQLSARSGPSGLSKAGHPLRLPPTWGSLSPSPGPRLPALAPTLPPGILSPAAEALSGGDDTLPSSTPVCLCAHFRGQGHPLPSLGLPGAQGAGSGGCGASCSHACVYVCTHARARTRVHTHGPFPFLTSHAPGSPAGAEGRRGWG